MNYLRDKKPEFLINAAGYTGKPNVDACEIAQADTLQGNTLLPQTIAHACAAAGHSVGTRFLRLHLFRRENCENGGVRVEKDLTRPDLQALVEKSPESIHGFTEDDAPNFSFREPPCSFYSGTKALGEEAIRGVGQSYIWRLRIPFDEFDKPRNYLSKVQRYPKVYDNVNSISHRGEFAQRLPGSLGAARAVWHLQRDQSRLCHDAARWCELVEKILKPERRFEFWESDEEFYRVAAKTPRSNCVLDVSKLLATGVKIRPVEEALEASLRKWKPET